MNTLRLAACLPVDLVALSQKSQNAVEQAKLSH